MHVPHRATANRANNKRRVMPRLVATLALFLFLVAPARSQDAAAEPPVLTLENALTEAQANNRLIKIANQDVLYSNDAILAARSQRYPQFNVKLTGSALLTAVDVTVPKGVFGNVGTTPVPND